MHSTSKFSVHTQHINYVSTADELHAYLYNYKASSQLVTTPLSHMALNCLWINIKLLQSVCLCCCCCWRGQVKTLTLSDDVCQCCNLLLFACVLLFKTLSLLNFMNKESESESQLLTIDRNKIRQSGNHNTVTTNSVIILHIIWWQKTPSRNGLESKKHTKNKDLTLRTFQSWSL